MLKVLAQALGSSTAATSGDSQVSCRALEKCVGAPTVFTREVRYVNTRCAKCGFFFFSTIRTGYAVAPGGPCLSENGV